MKSVLIFVSLLSVIPLNGVREINEIVNADSSIVYSEKFIPGFNVHIVMDGICYKSDFDKDIDLWIFDSNDQLVAKSTNTVCYEELNFVPTSEEPYQIVIENYRKPRATEFFMKIEAEFGEPNEQ